MTALAPSMFEILAALAAGPLHGYAIAKRIVELHDHRVRSMGPATLYSSIQRLEEMGFLEELEAAGEDSRRKTYRLTSAGVSALSEAFSSQRRFLERVSSSFSPDVSTLGGAQ